MPQVNIKKIRDEKICYVELNLPEKKNTLTMEMILELTKIFQNLSTNKDLKAIVLSGKGSHFCAGGDLRWMKIDLDKTSDSENIQEVKNLFRMFEAIRTCPIPVIAKVYGSVFGGGLGLVSVCDIIVSEGNSKFCFSELKLDLIPAVIAPFILKKIPLTFIKELVFSARMFDAKEALKIGLVHFVGTMEECEYHIKNLEDHFLRCDVMALRQSKKLLTAVPKLSLKMQEIIAFKLLLKEGRVLR